MALDAATDPTLDTVPSGYSVTDPGYSTIDEPENESGEDILASLKAENTKTPSKTLDDAGSEEEATEGSDETSTDSVDAESDDSDISDELLDRAIELGYTLEEMRQFTDAKALDKELTRVEAIRTRLEQKKAPPKTEPDPVQEETEPDWDKLIEMGHDEDLIKLSKTNWQRMKQAELVVKQLAETERQRQSIEQADRFDDTLSGMKEFKTLFGEGRRDSLNKAELANRQQVFTKMMVLRQGYEQVGQAVPNETDLINEAVHASFHKHAQQAARTSLKRDIKNASSQALSRPNGSGKNELTGEQKALAKEQAFWRAYRE